MKKALIFLLSLVAGIARGQTAISLVGKIVDSAGNKPLPNCSVYLNNTSIGTVSLEDGVFILKGIPHGRTELVVSAIGYSTFLLPLRGDSLPKDLVIHLHQTAAELSSFTVDHYMKDGWKIWGQFFLDNFIGSSGNASSCTLANRKALRFHYSKKNHRLSVSAVEPLIIHNKALGYDLKYQLEHFYFEEDTRIVFYQGYPLFHERAAGDDKHYRQWTEKRRKAYLGSLHHFIQSLYTAQTWRQHFLLETRVQVCNTEKQRVKQAYDPNAPVGTYNRDSLSYYWKIMKEPDSLSDIVRVDEDSIVKTAPGGKKLLSFRGPLTVKYFYDQMPLPDDFWESHLLLGADEVEIQDDGSYFLAQDLIADGYWAQTEKICNMLPLDYRLPDGPVPPAR
jgi:hypothetical protein